MTDTSSGWLEIAVPANAESVEAVSELLSRFGYNEGVVIEEPFRQDEDGENFEIDPERPVIVRTWLPIDAGLADRKRALDEALWHLRQIGGVGDTETTEREEEDWANAWKEHFPILRIGRRFVIRPTWREYVPSADDLVIHLDPGMAFGTGMHPSTEMCLRFIEELDLAGSAILDVGAGSGILSVAAILAGASSAVAVEIDPVAGRVLVENVALNGMAERIDVIVGDAADALPAGRTFPLVFANIIARILADNAAPISARVAPGGRLIASGIINEREQLVLDAYAAHGLQPIERKQGGDWVTILFARPG